MAKLEDNDDQDKRIEDLKRRAEELCGGEMEVGTIDDCPAELEESFWKYVVDYEEAPLTTNFQQLEEAGVSLPAPDSLNDEELTAKLWEVIHKLALLRVFLEQTDHLSDRELYTHLWTDSLREETPMMAANANGAWHIQMLGGCSDTKTISSISSITLMKLGASSGTKISPMIPFPHMKTCLTIVTGCCPRRITISPSAESPTNGFGDRLQS